MKNTKHTLTENLYFKNIKSKMSFDKFSKNLVD